MRDVLEGKVEEELWVRVTKTEGLVKSHTEIYYCRSFLEYICTQRTFKWSPLIMREKMPQLDIIWLPNTILRIRNGLHHFQLLAKGCPIPHSPHYRLLMMVFVTLYNPMLRPC